MDVGQRLGVEFELLPESVHLGFIGNEVLRRSAVFCAVSDVLRHGFLRIVQPSSDRTALPSDRTDPLRIVQMM